MKIFQKTVKKKLTFEGIALHAGVVTKINIYPAEINYGIKFIRKDLRPKKYIEASWRNIKFANLCTMIHDKGGGSISTIEHLMFSFYALGLTNILVEVNGPEIPILDGSSILFINEILKIGILSQNTTFPRLKIKSSFEIKDQKKFIRYDPGNSFLEIDYKLDYKDNFIRQQSKVVKNVQKNYKILCDARTFCHQEDLEKIFSMGLAKGGSLDNAIVIAGNKVLNQEGLRHNDEFVRHKILDCAGDLYLSGFFLEGKITCNHGGHFLTYCLLKKIFSNTSNYDILN